MYKVKDDKGFFYFLDIYTIHVQRSFKNEPKRNIITILHYLYIIYDIYIVFEVAKVWGFNLHLSLYENKNASELSIAEQMPRSSSVFYYGPM